jgi:hypothetical protein
MNTLLAFVLAVAAVPDASFLTGRWTGEKDGVAMEEYWSEFTGGTALGLHRDVKDGRLVSWEFFRIETTAEGTFYYASPRSAPPTPFKLVEHGRDRLVFENKEHDFPQRILYWKDAAGALHARIEGPMNGTTVSEEWSWTKTTP